MDTEGKLEIWYWNSLNYNNYTRKKNVVRLLSKRVFHHVYAVNWFNLLCDSEYFVAFWFICFTNVKGSLTYRFYPQETSILRLGVGVLAAMTFSLLHVLGKFTDIFVKNFWTFWKHLGKVYKITFALNSLVSSFCFSQILNIVYLVVWDFVREKAVSLIVSLNWAGILC